MSRSRSTRCRITIALENARAGNPDLPLPRLAAQLPAANRERSPDDIHVRGRGGAESRQVDGRQIRVVWFNLPAYMRGYLPGGERVLVRGRVAAGTDGTIEIVQPELHRMSDGDPKGIRPVYRLPSIVGQRLFANLVTHALTEAGDSVAGAIPDEVRGNEPTVRDALNFLHDPPSDADFDALSNGESRGHLAL